MRRIYLVSLVVVVALFGACNSHDAKLSGRLLGNENQNIYLEKVVSGGHLFMDSTVINDRGEFRFKVRLSDGLPAIYNLKCGVERVPLLIAPKERIKVYSVANLGRNYTVEGSEGSEQMRQLKDILSEGAARLDSILVDYTSSSDQQERERIGAAYTSEYYDIKRQHIAFIVANTGSLSSVYALFQSLPNETNLFAEEKDIIYFRMVADSAEVRYPNSPYVDVLKRHVVVMERELEMRSLLRDKLGDGAMIVNYPELNMPDMYGNKHKLSSLAGRVILLDFWLASSQENRMMNAELKQTYDKIRLVDWDFEIYQVGADENKAMWVNTVQQQKLPWISVCDFKGGSSPALMTYNIKEVPSNFLIDRNGDIVAKNIYGEELLAKVKELNNNSHLKY